jgi:prepilin-type N-terminal cleavage/methylation domain-containing protein/prepilin-type processing-associated H-X9-DG protein
MKLRIVDWRLRIINASASSIRNPKSAMMNTGDKRAFTLIEVLVVLSILGFLLAILLPGLARARGQARASVCQSNIRQIALANHLYAQESGGVYCPGAGNFLANRHRWHGQRNSTYEAFDSTQGPLVDYLGPDGAIRACPAFEPHAAGFEAGNGGYGYNNAYIGVQVVAWGSDRAIVTSDLAGAYAARVKRPGETVMFTDAAFAAGGLIEYSFAEPRFHPQFGSRADPSIHFRHDKSAHAVWCDGHVTRETRTFSWKSGFYRGDPERYDIGWFGKADDNSLFDLW